MNMNWQKAIKGKKEAYAKFKTSDRRRRLERLERNEREEN